MLPGSFSERGHACVRACASGGSAPVPQRRAAQRARAGGQARGERAAARPAGQRGQRVAEAPVQVPGQLALQRRALPRPRARIGLPTLSLHRTLPAQEPRAYGALGYRNARSWRATAGNIAARSRTFSRVTYVLTAERRRGGAARLRGQGAEPEQAGQHGHAGGRHAAQRLRISKCRVPLRAARAAGRRH